MQDNRISNVNVASTQAGTGVEINKVLRNTYILLGLTLANSAIFAAIAMSVSMPGYMPLVLTLAAFGVLFIVHKTADSAAGLGWTFVFTALLGASLGPMLTRYLALANGPELVMQALAGTSMVFFGLSAYALTSRKDFSFMGGFLLVGLLVVVVASIANIFLAIPAVSLAISSAAVLIFSGLILFDTSRIIHGGETNYIRATVGLYLNIYNLFIHMLHLLAVFTGDD